jgi:uncharacterized protein
LTGLRPAILSHFQFICARLLNYCKNPDIPLMPYLDKIYIYPIKSLDRSQLSKVEVLPSGALKGDRTYAMIDSLGKFVNAKRYPQIHLLRSQFDMNTQIVQIKTQNQGQDSSYNFDLSCSSGCQDFERWMSEFFGFKVALRQNLEMGFPDDTDSPAPTIVTTATLQTMQSWYPDLSLEEVRLRFRTNLEISGMEAFGEDRLFAVKDEPIKFQIGNVEFLGINPCARCVVPTRNPQTGEVYPNFQKIFIKNRQEFLSTWAERSQFNHFYRLTVNTRISQLGDGILRQGDRLTISINS